MGGAGELAQRQRIHVIERRGDEIAVTVEAGRKARLHDPDVRLVGEHDPFRGPGRARSIEEHCGLARARQHRLERARVEETVEPRRASAAELDAGEARRRVARSLLVAEQELAPASCRMK